MQFLLDTCVISEPLQKLPDANVLEFLAALTPSESYISVVTVGELRKGAILLPPDGQR